MKKVEKRTGLKTGPKETAFQAVERNGAEIAKVGDSVFYFAELGMQEVETCRLLVGVLRDIGYTVETGISGFPTGFLATYGSGKPVIAVHVEYDALPSGSQTPGSVERRELVPGAPGHAEGHNTNPAVMVGAAFAIKEAIDRHRLTGTIKLFGSPAEEQLVSRSFFVRDGLFRDVDAALHVHVGDELLGGLRGPVLRPDLRGVRVLRQDRPRGKRPLAGGQRGRCGKADGHRLGRPQGAPPPDPAEPFGHQGRGRPAERGPRLREDLVVLPRGDRPGGRGALRPGAEDGRGGLPDDRCDPQGDGGGGLLAQLGQQAPGRTRPGEHRTRRDAAVERGGPGPGQAGPEGRRPPGDRPGDEGDAPDAGKTGRGLLRLRGHHLRRARTPGSIFPANIPGTEAHHWSAGIAPATPIAHKGEVAGAKVLAGTLVDLLTEPRHLVGAKKWFDKELAEAGIAYAPLLPPETKPPVHLNREEMAKYRGRMKKFYLNAPIRFK